MTPRLVLVVREDGSVQASCDCGGLDEIVAARNVAKFMLDDAAGHVVSHSAMESQGAA